MKKIIFVLLFLILIAFKTGDNKSSYTVPRAANSVTSGDIDMDGDNDIVVGHNYSSQTQWSGVSIMLNDGNGYFTLFDSVFLFGWQPDIQMENINTGLSKEIIAKYEDPQNENEYITIINDFDLTDISYFSLNTYEGVDRKTFGDINGDGNMDIVVASNGGKFWGVLFNDGSGNFSDPEYHYVTDYFPTALACGDLNDDGRDDIVVCGQSTEVYFSYPDGFQSLLLETNNYKQGVSIVDFDLDGDNDILTFVGIPIVNLTSLIMYQNQGNNSFDTLEGFFFQPISSKFFVTDFNNDSLQDVLFQLSDNSGFVIYYNQGNFQLGDSLFIPLEPYGYEGVRDCYCADMDGNGYNDIIITRLAQVILPDNLVILFNDGNGNFVNDPVSGNQPSNVELQTSNLTCYPNPSGSLGTKIAFLLKEKEFVTLQIFDIRGNLINTLINKELLSGNHKIIWNAKSHNGKEVKPGIYIIRLNTDRNVYTQKIIV